MKSNELREMSDEQLQATLRETVDQLFRLRIQSQTERLDAPSELHRNRRLVARIKTEQRAREIAAGNSETPAAAATAVEEDTES
jgi:large subunit ribosomal protein L29|tara:strand:+ start:594 stop:845 length:252 start_codon:yes stop_codon:yes gene_type:complete